MQTCERADVTAPVSFTVAAGVLVPALIPASNQPPSDRLCSINSAARRLGDVPAGFLTPGHQPQFSWAEGNHLKIVGCQGNCASIDSRGCTAPYPGWHFFLYNLTSDRSEKIDLWEQQRPTALSMLDRFTQWQHSIWCSTDVGEIGCQPNPYCNSSTLY